MKRNHLIIIAIIIGIVGIFTYFKGGLTNVTNNSSQSQSYYNANRGIKFQYPSTWAVDSQIVDGPNPIISKIDRDSDTSVILLHSANTDNFDLEGYKKSSVKELEFAPDYSFIAEENKTVNGIQTYQITATYANGIKGKSVLFLSPNSDKLFTMIYRTTQEKFDLYLSEFDEMLNTLELN